MIKLKLASFNDVQQHHIDRTLDIRKAQYKRKFHDRQWSGATIAKNRIDSILRNADRKHTVNWIRCNAEFLRRVGLANHV